MEGVYECLPAELRGVGNPSRWAARGGGKREIDEMSERCYDENKSVSQISAGDRRSCENHDRSMMSVYPDPAPRPFLNVQRLLSVRTEATEPNKIQKLHCNMAG